MVLSISCNSIEAKVTIYSGFNVLTSPIGIVIRHSDNTLTSRVARVTARGGTRGVMLKLPGGVSNSRNFHTRTYQRLTRLVSREVGLPVSFRSRELAAISTRGTLGTAGAHNGGHGTIISTISTIVVLRSCLEGAGGRGWGRGRPMYRVVCELLLWGRRGWVIWAR